MELELAAASALCLPRVQGRSGGRGQDGHARAGDQSQGHSQIPECEAAAGEPLQVQFDHL